MALEYEEIDLGQVDGTDGTNGREIEIQASSTQIEQRYKGETTWRAIIALASLIGPQGLMGPAGKKLMVQKTSTHLQYKYEGDTTWTNWVALTDITGPIGLPGPKGDAGSQLLYYAGVPTTAIGVKGDTCIDTSSKDWDVYYKSTDIKWDKKGYLKGESGGLGGDTVPIGTMMHFTGLVVQDGWLPCDGCVISRVDYAELFIVIGTSYGAGNGTTTFNIPNEPNPVSYIPTETGGTQLITHEPALKVIIKAKQAVPVIASVEDSLTSDSKTNALSAAQGKALKEMVDGSYPTTKTVFGNIGKSGDVANKFDFHARLTCEKTANDLYKVYGQGLIDATIGNSASIDYGIDLSSLKNLLGINFTTLVGTPKAKFFRADGTSLILNTTINGYGGLLQFVNGVMLRPARYYNTQGAVGGWEIRIFRSTDMIEFELYLNGGA